MELLHHGTAAIAYRTRGTGDPIVFLHNGGASCTIWRHQVDELSAHHRTVAVDLPGFGCAPLPSTPLDLDGLVELVAALLDELDVTDALVVGNCMGSNIAAGLAEQRPDLVSGLVLVNPLTAATFSAGWLGTLHRIHHVAAAPSRFGRRVARKITPPRTGAVLSVRFQLGSKGVARDLHHDPELVALYTRHDQLPALVDVLDDMDAYGRLDRNPPPAVPICTVWGDQNRVLSPKAGRRLGSRLAPVRAEVLAGCGHLPMLEDPDAVTAIIADAAATLASTNDRRSVRA